MNIIVDFIKKKALGFWFAIASVVLLFVGVICFGALTNVSFELDENPALIITFCVLAMVLLLVACWRDFFKALSLVAVMFVSIVLFAFISGRVSYLAYYFSGDILGTGLSPLFVVSLVCFVLAFITTICTVCIKIEKKS